jgi:hypothetical protein
MIVMQFRGLTQAIDAVHNMSRKLPQTADKDLWNLSQILGSELRKGIDMARIQDYTGYLRASTVPNKSGEHEYSIPLPYYAQQLDSMREHSVKLTTEVPNVRLLQWALFRGFDPANMPKYLYVRPHPFIQGAFDRLNQRIKGELENGATAKMIKNKGK